MDVNEKILLIQCILMDIRCDWRSNLKNRTSLALNTINEVIEVKGMKELKFRVEEFIEAIDKRLEVDGRVFRNEYPLGYENMDKIHNLSRTYSDKSEEFKKEISKLNSIEFYIEDL